ncbi:MAG: leucine-rich repeat domain-containing protein [Eubacterium sp.]
MIFFYGVSCTDIKLADSIESIGGYAFSGAQIEHIKLPDKLKYINNDAFYFCDNLKEIVFPKSISSIGRLHLKIAVFFQK